MNKQFQGSKKKARRAAFLEREANREWRSKVRGELKERNDAFDMDGAIKIMRQLEGKS